LRILTFPYNTSQSTSRTKVRRRIDFIPLGWG
jgi:hypothetical protein